MLDTERSTADTPPVRHELGGIVYLNFFERFFTTVRPSSYFEIGVSMGNSLRHARCASVAVDPRIKAEGTDFIGEKPALHLFQMKSDDFFATYDLRNFLPQGVDAAFLDGMHQFEFLLRDFINTEKYVHRDSVVMLHDCLPINAEMTERTPRQTLRKDVKLANFWTGDVWKLVPILRKYRPDLGLTVLDCPPTGLVLVQGFGSGSTALVDNYDKIVADYIDVELDDESLVTFRNGLEITSSRQFVRQLKATRGEDG